MFYRNEHVGLACRQYTASDDLLFSLWGFSEWNNGLHESKLWICDWYLGKRFASHGKENGVLVIPMKSAILLVGFALRGMCENTPQDNQK